MTKWSIIQKPTYINFYLQDAQENHLWNRVIYRKASQQAIDLKLTMAAVLCRWFYKNFNRKLHSVR